MCGRYTLATPSAVVEEVFGVGVDLVPRYNIAPTQRAPVMRNGPAGPEWCELRWGLVPFWAKEESLGSRMINARSETAHEKPAFRAAMRARRCLVPADGFYEWKRDGGVKQPYLVHRRDDRPFALAGLWERWEGGDEEPLETFTILTCGPNELVAGLHDRMPVILDDDAWERWLAGGSDTESLRPLLVPAPAGLLEAFPVGRTVNSPANDVPACRTPIGPAIRV